MLAHIGKFNVYKEYGRIYVDLGEYAEEATIIVEETATPSITFLEANTDSITLEELANKCVVPTWANQELTVAHQDFVSCVHEAASSFYAGEKVNFPEIRVSHIVRGRIPSAFLISFLQHGIRICCFPRGVIPETQVRPTIFFVTRIKRGKIHR